MDTNSIRSNALITNLISHKTSHPLKTIKNFSKLTFLEFRADVLRKKKKKKETKKPNTYSVVLTNLNSYIWMTQLNINTVNIRELVLLHKFRNAS